MDIDERVKEAATLETGTGSPEKTNKNAAAVRDEIREICFANPAAIFMSCRRGEKRDEGEDGVRFIAPISI